MFKANVWARDSELNVLEKKQTYDMLALCAFLEVKLVKFEVLFQRQRWAFKILPVKLGLCVQDLTILGFVCITFNSILDHCCQDIVHTSLESCCLNAV